MSATIALSLQEEYFFSIERPRVSAEKTLNFFGYIPGLSIPSGMARIGIALLDTIQFVARGCLCLIGSLFFQSYANLVCASRFFYYSVHAIGNIVRGAVEMAPLPFVFFALTPESVIAGLAFHLISKPFMVYYDCLLDARFKYPVEYLKPSTAKP